MLLFIFDKVTRQYIKSYSVAKLEHFVDDGSFITIWDSQSHDLNTYGYELYPGQKFTVQYEDVVVRHTDDGEPVYKQRIAWQTIDSLNLQGFESGSLPRSEHVARLKAVSPPPAKRPAIVTRVFMGVEYDIPCYATQIVRDQYQAGDIQIGDFMLVSFIAEYVNGREVILPIAIAKVFKSW